ncbi:MAG: tRNA (N(6)-L-threonylcarbamoyladenosine(37)-C(2))-methylthiotransferase MtaB [SAR324 cluster bacterium]|nr:tRNA (N(6)-L-threonylcarbamoyladenosine(37)-C(2))-methylthiotransferase MtaB [SAR324 cluster bacterium]
MQKALFHTLGCRLNQAESASMAKSLKNAGYEITTEATGADLVVINSCTVTGQSDQKTRQAVRSLQRANPTAVTCVVGCMSQVASAEILDIGGVDLILGTEEKLNIGYWLKQKQPDEPLVAVGTISKASFSIDTLGQHSTYTRPNIKIQDGCNFLCSFCIIPVARGRSRSRELDNLLKEVDWFVAKGTQEIVLTGVNLGEYNDSGLDFLGLLDRLNEVKGLARVRISSIEPTTVDRGIFVRMKEKSHNLQPYLHLPLQAATDKILGDMRRRYTLKEYQQFILDAKETIPNLGLGTDLLTGYPTETEEDFAEGYKFVQTQPFAYFHVFPYAKREGARSAKLDSLETKELGRRVDLLRSLSDEKKQAFASAQIGTTQEVLFEGTSGEVYSGYCGNFLRVKVASKVDLSNQIHPVKITSAKNGTAFGNIISEVKDATK